MIMQDSLRALRDYKKEKDDELTFRKGDIIKVLKLSEQLCKGKLDGKKGIFPISVDGEKIVALGPPRID